MIQTTSAAFGFPLTNGFFFAWVTWKEGYPWFFCNTNTNNARLICERTCIRERIIKTLKRKTNPKRVCPPTKFRVLRFPQFSNQKRQSDAVHSKIQHMHEINSDTSKKMKLFICTMTWLQTEISSNAYTTSPRNAGFKGQWIVCNKYGFNFTRSIIIRAYNDNHPLNHSKCRN